MRKALIVLAAAALLAAALLAVATRPLGFARSVELPLPPAVGGHLPVLVAGTARLRPLALQLELKLTMSVDERQLSAVLPATEFSILVDEPDHPALASMLGRATFAPGSAQLSADARSVRVSAVLQGEFYVRPKREYRKDEEQSEAGDVRPFAGTVSLAAANLVIDADWQLRFEPPVAAFELDRLTGTAWQDAYGIGNGFALSVERLLAQRAGGFVAGLGITARDLRPPLVQALDTLDAELATRSWLQALRRLRIVSVATDNCPSQAQAGTVMLGLTLQLDLRGAQDARPALPALQVRAGPCR